MLNCSARGGVGGPAAWLLEVVLVGERMGGAGGTMVFLSHEMPPVIAALAKDEDKRVLLVGGVTTIAGLAVVDEGSALVGDGR